MIHLKMKGHDEAQCQIMPTPRGVLIVISDEYDPGCYTQMVIDRVTLERWCKESAYLAWRQEWEARHSAPGPDVPREGGES